MRSRYRATVLATLALIPVVAAVLVAPIASAAQPPAAGEQTVSFAGATVQVPAGWPVVDVDGVAGCVRYDRHAVYLGQPSEINCPARVIGQTSTVQILRSGGVAEGGDGTVVLAGSPAGPRVVITTDSPDNLLATEIAASVRIDGSPARVLSQSRADAPDTDRTAALSAPPVRSDATSPAATMTGLAFDACSAPSLTQIDAWTSSPYGAVGVYVGGISRACAQPNLTSSWVSAMHTRGWHLLPIYVGLQAPCTRFTNRISPTAAASQGTAAAGDAAAKMAALGLAAGNPVYLDMESWNDDDTACTTAVMTFLDAWTVKLHEAGYVSGFYSSASTGMAALVSTIKTRVGFHRPDAIWFARWDGVASTTGDAAIPDNMWPNHQRVKQYQGPHDEKYGGRSINIDSDVVDGPVTPAALAVGPASLPSAVPDKPYTATLAGRGGVAPYRFAVTSGTLPQGLTLSSSGVLSGAAGTVSTGSVTITVTDALGATAFRSYPVTVTYTDVPAGSTFFADIAWLANSGITTGYPDGTFRPTAAVSRQSMAAFLYRYADPGTTPPACTAAPFPDVAANDTFCPEITWLASTGITGGYPDGTFKPTAAVSRQSMAAFLYRYANPGTTPPACTAAPFPDVAATDTFCPEITWLASTGITGGYPDGTFRPTTTVSRQSMAAFLHRLDQQ